MTDYRALCAELADDLEEWVDGYLINDPADDYTAATLALVNRARAALAVEVMGPSEDRVATLERELERERLRLAACGVVAMADTPKSAAEARKIHLEYHSGSLDDVIRQIDALMEARAVLARYGSTPRPIPVAERLPGAEDCDSSGECWIWDWLAECWRMGPASWLETERVKDGYDWWLPARAMPIPTQENADG